MNNLATAQHFQDCVTGLHGTEWEQRANDFMERAQDWPGEAFWAEWHRIRAAEFRAKLSPLADQIGRAVFGPGGPLAASPGEES